MSRIPTITKNLLLINVLAYALTWMLDAAMHVDLNDVFGLHFFMASDFHLYQIITYMFMHGGLMHLFFNMFALWMFGCVIENVLGPRRFIAYYLLCGIGAGLFQEAAQFVDYAIQGLAAYQTVSLNGVVIPVGEYLNKLTTVGASGSVYGILLAFGMIFPEQRMFIFPLPVPIKAKWFVVAYAAIELYSALSTANDGVAHIAHLGGMVVGFFLLRYWRNHPATGYGTNSGFNFDNMKGMWEKMRGGGSRNNNTFRTTNTRTSGDVDREYNARKKVTQDEIDAILDKIRKSGYDSLTKDEKQKLFDQSSNK